jgi:putative addiction module antidote
MEIKVTQIGNSLGVILPKELLERLGIEKGDRLTVVEQSNAVTLTPFDPEFAETMEIAREGMRKYRNALNELAK